MDFLRDRRVWIAAAVIVVLLVVANVLGWFGGETPTTPAQ